MGLCLSAGSPPLEAAPAERSAAVAVEVPELTVRELQKATGSFAPSRQIGKGRFATVYWASLQNGRIAAAKRLHLPRTSGRWDAVTVLRQQVNVMSRLSHSNLVRILGCTAAGDLGVVLYEFAPLGTLHDALHGPREASRQGRRPAGFSSVPQAVCLSWAQRVRIALDAASGLEYMHEEASRTTTTHGDVRSTNVLLFDGFQAKLGDNNLFRDAQASDYPTRLPVGVLPPVYTAPEILIRSGRATPKSDTYSFGVVLLELLTGRLVWPVWDDNTRVSLVEWVSPLLREGRIQECIDPKLGDQYSPAAALKLGRIAAMCVRSRATDRPSMRTVAGEIYLLAEAELHSSLWVRPHPRQNKISVMFVEFSPCTHPLAT